MPLLIWCPVKDYDFDKKRESYENLGISASFDILESAYFFILKDIIYLAAFYGSSTKE